MRWVYVSQCQNGQNRIFTRTHVIACGTGQILPQVVIHQANSRLLIMAGGVEQGDDSKEQNTCWVRYYVERYGKLVKIKQDSYTSEVQLPVQVR